MLEKCKIKPISNYPLQKSNYKTIEKDQYDSNNQFYLNTVSSTHKTIQSAQRSPPQDNYKTTILSERKSKGISDINKSTRAITKQERLKQRNLVNLELFRVITFDNIGQDQNGNEILISKTIDIEDNTTQWKHLRSQSHNTISNRGGIVNLEYRLNYNKGKQFTERIKQDLENDDNIKTKGIALIKSIICQYENYYRRLLIKQLRMNFENKRKKGQCRNLLRELRKVQLKKNKSCSSIIVDKTLREIYDNTNEGKENSNKDIIIYSKKCVIHHSFYSKSLITFEIINHVKLIQVKWRKYSRNKKHKDILKSLINKFPVLKAEMIKKKKSQLSLKTHSKRTDNPEKSCNMYDDNKSIIKINKINSYKVTKVNHTYSSLFNKKVTLIQQRWIAKHKVNKKSCTNNVLMRIKSSLSFITKDFHTDIRQNTKNNTNIQFNKNNVKQIQNLSKANNKNNNLIQQNHNSSLTYQIQTESLIHKVKFTYSIAKILSKVIQENYFFVLKRKHYNTNINPVFHSFYYKTLRNHLLLIETQSNHNQIEKNQSKLYVQLSLCQYFSLSSSLDFYSLSWNDKQKENQNELSLINDVFQSSNKNHLINYIILYLNAYYKETITKYPFLNQFFSQHLSQQKDHFNTSIFGISRYINDLLDAVIILKIPYCPKCCCFSIVKESNKENDMHQNSNCGNIQIEGKKRLLHRAKSNVDIKGLNVKVMEQRIDTHNNKKHIIKVSIERNITKKNYIEANRLNRQMRYENDVNFFNMVKETRFKLNN